jgi:hypothetical protein
LALAVTDPLAVFWIHTISVRRAGSGADDGRPQDFATATDELGFVSDGAHLVFTPTGEQMTATSKVALRSSTPYVPIESLVTLPAQFGPQVPRRVVAVAVGDGAEIGLPAHLELSLL